MISALAEQPIFHVSEHRREDARRRALSVAIVALIYGGLAAALLFRNDGVTTVSTEEIPVEIVVAPPEPPPPEPEKQKEETRKKREADLSPAFDAPKPGEAKEDNGDRPKDAKPPPAPEAPDKSAERAPSAQARDEAPKPEASPAPSPEPAETELPTLRESENGELPLARPQAASPAPAAAPRPFTSAGKFNSPVFASLPDVNFDGGAAIKTPIANGHGPGNYLNIVYGMIQAKLRRPVFDLPGSKAQGVIQFSVDQNGRVVNHWFVVHSRSPDWDRAEINALIAAAPYPPPPFISRTIQYSFVGD